jgi:hypothetical protein
MYQYRAIPMKYFAILSIWLLSSCQERQKQQMPETVDSENVWAEFRSKSVLMDADIDPFVAVQNMSVPEVKVLLDKMYQADQQYRDSLYNGNPDRKDYYGKKMMANDQANHKLLNKIMDQYGWPDRQRFGEAGSEAAWYVAWHQRGSERSMAYYLKFMEEANRRQGINEEQFLLVKNQLANLRSVGRSGVGD